ncbi:uncharacterized protein A1O9_03218 [Exophiala aquamarina CBS 119918]|uniref:Uncharacterized protein n=1 Tax=Exophiala aquamarina CBS 119918 TaxID=1182545 RepID=A0A072Q170_9EURO|nr:uncharacterized protein A1O9_03218 [Exophiala aquamarina CBS 119918]KEF61650.1 hypothetical protein A1O9_03218 [Exophiala aquamarina CBS 119918]
MATGRKPQSVHDAWAVTNTDTAFAFNNEVGVQMTHTSNGWLSGNLPLFAVKSTFPFVGMPMIPRDLSLDGHSVYVYISKGPYVVTELDDPVTNSQVITEVVENNDSAQTKHFEFSYSKTTSQSTSLTVSETTGLKVESKVEIDGFSFGVEASFDKTRTSENSQTLSSTTTVTESTEISPHTKFHYKVIEKTTTTQTLYGLDFRIGSEVAKDGTVTGGIAKATQFGRDSNLSHLSNCDRFFPVEQLANTTQTAKYHVTTTKLLTRIETNNPTSDT